MTVLVVPHVRRVDVVFAVEVAERPEVDCGGEAVSSQWLDPADVDEADGPTREILAAWARARSSGRVSGRATGGTAPA